MNGIQQWGGYSGQQLAPQGLLGSMIGGTLEAKLVMNSAAWQVMRIGAINWVKRWAE